MGSNFRPRAARVLVPAVVMGTLIGAVGIVGASPAVAAPVTHASSLQLPVTAPTATREADGSYQLTWTQAPYVSGVTVKASINPRENWLTAQPVVTGAAGGTTVTGLDPNSRWYFYLTPDGFPLGVEVADRHLQVAGVNNARDIGGYLTSSGLQVRWGVVFHSGRLNTATNPTGVTQLADLGLTEDVDFRTDVERAAGGPDPVPPTVTYVCDPIGNPDQAEPTPPPPPQVPQPVDPITAGYLLFVTNSHLRAQFGDALTRIADQPQTPLLFHDTGGNNRVGWMTTVVLMALGVPRDVVYQDYLLSTGLVSASYLDAAFDEVTAMYGTFNAYLVFGLGVSPLTIARLRLELLQPQL